MYDNFAKTFAFTDIYPDYDTFKTRLTAAGIDNAVFADDVFPKKIYSILYNRFCDSNFAFDTPGDIDRHFIITLENVFDKFRTRSNMLEKIYQLTPADMEIIGTNFDTLTENNNTPDADALDELAEYITSQSGHRIRANKLIQYLEYVRRVPDRYFWEISDEFINMFMRIIPESRAIFIREED